MKGKEWQYTEYTPDREDIDAISNASLGVANWTGESGLGIHVFGVRVFRAGFKRGIRWALDKHQVEALEAENARLRAEMAQHAVLMDRYTEVVQELFVVLGRLGAMTPELQDAMRRVRVVGAHIADHYRADAEGE